MGDTVNENANEMVFSVINAPESSNSTDVFYSVSLPSIQDNYHNVLIKFNGTAKSGLVNLTSATSQPRFFLSGTYKAVTAYPQSISLCNIPALTPMVYVSLFPSADFVGSVSFIASVYEGELDFNGRTTLTAFFDKGSLFYFWSAAYSETDIARRLVVQGSGGNAYLSGPFNDCHEDSQIVSSPNYCIDLPLEENIEQNPTTYYYGVYFDNDYNGMVSLELGSCATYSGVQTLLLSVISLVAVLLFI